MNEELKYRLALTLIPGIGHVIGKKLVAYCGSAEAVFRQKKPALLRIPGVGDFFANAVLRQNVFDLAEQEMRFMEEENIRALFYLDDDYPYRLKQCADCPVILYYKGEGSLNAKRMIGIVGTRNATPYGIDRCNELVAELASHEVCIVSGLAYGIDICAHKAALKNDLCNWAVLAHGLDVIYPPLHRDTARRLIEKGGLLSDFPQGSPPDKENFPKRNRIVAGLIDALVVIESAANGGSMITADIANSYNRDVFAFPGRTVDVQSLGCNKLIKQNKASLADNATDIIRLLGWEDKPPRKAKQQQLFVELSADEQLVLDQLNGSGNMHVDELTVLSGVSMRAISAVLLNLEFAGLLKSLPGKMYRLN
jgi:DNA processing protein